LLQKTANTIKLLLTCKTHLNLARNNQQQQHGDSKKALAAAMGNNLLCQHPQTC
jgi:hypothetical protein